jgi:hypothetical protein
MEREFSELNFPRRKSFNCFFITFRNSSFNFLFLSHFWLLRSCLIILENFCHTMFIAALIINKNESLLTFSTNITKHILTTPMDINVALTFEEMVMRNTLKTRLFVWSIFGTGSDILLSCWRSFGDCLDVLTYNKSYK